MMMSVSLPVVGKSGHFCGACSVPYSCRPQQRKFLALQQWCLMELPSSFKWLHLILEASSTDTRCLAFEAVVVFSGAPSCMISREPVCCFTRAIRGGVPVRCLSMWSPHASCITRLMRHTQSLMQHQTRPPVFPPELGRPTHQRIGVI